MNDLALPAYFAVDGSHQPGASWSPTQPTALLPGSFNPPHSAHFQLADCAAEILGRPVAFELSIVNVDKPELARAELEVRLRSVRGRATIWVTRAARFVDKAALFPGATFVVGADTAARLIDCRYYDDSDDRMLAALATIDQNHCRFLVAGRADAHGRFLGLHDLPVPAPLRHLFAAIPESVFRLDVSSSALRSAAGG